MTDKIIIDGVDVSECTYYLIKDGSCMSQDCECIKCVHNSCYYKDLKLLQNKYDTLTNKFFNSETDKTHLKQENEKLKKEVKQIGSSFIKKGDYARVLEQKIEKYSAINEQETKDYAELKKENEQLKEVAAKRLIEEGVFINTLDKLRKIIDEKLEKENKLINTLQDIKTLVTTDYIQIKKQLVQNYDCLDNFMQKIEDKCGEVL